MAMVCSQCKRAFDQQVNCPDCGVRLLFQVRNVASSDSSQANGEAQWQQTPWGRMGIGLILAQGLSFGMQQLLTAGILASGEAASVWTTLWGIVLLHTLQGLSLIVGGAISGAGKQRGLLYGAFVGLLNGIIFLLVQRQSGEVLTEALLYGQPILHMSFGALGGLVGILIWKPMPTLQILDQDGESKTIPVAAVTFQFLAGPVYPGRVFLGVAMVVIGVVWSNGIVNWVLNASGGTLEIRSHLQAQLVGWEVSALATLFGAGLAGATTFNGLKQGLCVGFGSSLVLAGIHIGTPKIMLETTVFMIFGIILLAIAGGWFGGQLFPPVANVKRRNRILTG